MDKHFAIWAWWVILNKADGCRELAVHNAWGFLDKITKDRAGRKRKDSSSNVFLFVPGHRDYSGNGHMKKAAMKERSSSFMVVQTGHQSLSDTGTRIRPQGSLEIGC